MTTDNKLAPGWTWTTLSEVCGKIQDGTHFSPKNQLSQGIYRYITAKNVRPWGMDLSDVTYLTEDDHREINQRCDARVGDVLLVKDGVNTGDAAINSVNEEISLLSSVCMLRPRTEALRNQFLRYYLLSPTGAAFLTGKMTGTAIRRIILKRIKETPIPLAPLVEQARIVERAEELLSDLDAGVAALGRARANLKKYRAAVLKAAVTGDLTAEWRAKHAKVEPATKLLDRILAERRRKWEAEQQAKFAKSGKSLPKGWESKFEESSPPLAADLPELPRGWCRAKVNQVGDVRLGRQRSPQHHTGPHMRPYLRVANVFENRIDISDVLQMNFTPDEYETYRLRHGDILLNEGQSLHLVGRPAMYRDEVPGACFQNTLVRFRAASCVLPEFSLYVFLAYLHNKRFQKIAQWTVNIAHLSSERFSNIEFPLPPLDEQRVIVEEVEQQLSDIDATANYITASLKRAARLRQSILKEAFAGLLVPQDPSDEPADVLLGRIRTAAAVLKPPTRSRREQPLRRRRVTKDIILRRAAIASYIVRRLHTNSSFGRTQLVKALHLAQTHIGIDLDLVFERHPLGPLDMDIYKTEGFAKKQGWFLFEDRANKKGVNYKLGPNIDERCQEAEAIIGDKRASLDRLLTDFEKMNTDQAELFSTVFAAWNDLIFDQRATDNDAIVAEVYAWHESKKKFTRKDILERMSWMRDNGYVPTGSGARTLALSAEGGAE